MKLINDREVGLLRLIAHAPRSSRALTDGWGEIAPSTVHLYLRKMEILGFISAPDRQDGNYAVTSSGLDYLDNLPTLTPSPTYGAHSTKEPYKPPKWGRETAPVPSRGMG